MNQSLLQLFLYIFIFSLTVYLLVSIYRKELPIIFPIRLSGVKVGFHLKGWRAIFLSVFLLFIFIPFLIVKFNLIFFLLSFIVGIPSAFILHSSFHKFFKRNPGFVISNKFPPRKIETSNLILYGILGIFIGIFTFMFANIIFRVVGFSVNVAIIFSILVFLTTIILTARWGAKTNWTQNK